MQSANENGLLAVLPPVIYDRLAPSLKWVRLDAGDILYDIGAVLNRAWFLTRGIASLLSVTEDGETVEAAMIGPDGMIGFPGIVRKNGAAFRACVHVASEGVLCEAKALRAVIEQGNGFYDLLLDYACCLSEQIAQGLVCTRFHPREQRLARWLLLAQDRTRSDEFTLTHDALSQIFGLSRSGVSLAARALQKKGLIDYSRGHIAILNRDGLDAASCECYRILSQDLNFRAFRSHPSKSDRVKL